MRLDAQLLAAGYQGVSETFKECLADTSHAIFPNRTVDDLVCQPRDALHYCNCVRSQAECGDLSDLLILKTLMNMRKNPS